MKARCAELCEVILLTTSVPEPIWRWPRTLRSREPWRSQNAGASSRVLNLEDSITNTSATPLRDRSSVSAIMVSDILRWTCEPTQSVRQPRPHLFPADELLFALSALRSRTCFLATARLAPSATPQGWSCTDEVFSKDRSGLVWLVAVEPDFDVQVAQRTHLHRRKRGPPAPSLCDRSRT
jgi:hypothetical protein